MPKKFEYWNLPKNKKYPVLKNFTSFLVTHIECTRHQRYKELAAQAAKVEVKVWMDIQKGPGLYTLSKIKEYSEIKT